MAAEGFRSVSKLLHRDTIWRRSSILRFASKRPFAHFPSHSVLNALDRRAEYESFDQRFAVAPPRAWNQTVPTTHPLKMKPFRRLAWLIVVSTLFLILTIGRFHPTMAAEPGDGKPSGNDDRQIASSKESQSNVNPSPTPMMQNSNFPNTETTLTAAYAEPDVAQSVDKEPSAETATDSIAERITSVEGITEYRLENGVQVLLFPDPSKEVVTVNMTVFVGSRHEGYGEAGMAHLLEHMLFKGTAAHPEIPKALKDRGARMNGTTWVDRTNYYETLPATDDNLKFALELESDRLQNSFIRGEDLESEMTVVRNEFESGENSPIRILMQRVQSAAFDWHNYGKSTIGNRSDIERVPVLKLRDFYKKFYRPDNIQVVIAGKFDTNTALQYAADTFGKLKSPATPIDQTYTTEPAQDGERTVVLRRVGDIQYAAAAYHIPAGSHPDYAAAKALVYILGDEPSGRLYKQLVKSEVASNVFTIAYAFREPGLFMAIAEVAADKSIEQARLDLIDGLESGWAENPITQVELDRAVQQILKERELEASDTDKLAVALSDWSAQGDWRLYFLYRDAVENLTVEQVQKVAETYFTRNNRTVGLFIPTEAADRISIPEAPDVNELVKNYEGREEIAAGESFDPSPLSIEARTERGTLVEGMQYALLPKKTRGETVNMRLTLRFGTDESLKGRVGAVEMLGILMNRGTERMNFQQLQDELNRLRAEISVSSTVGLLQMSVKTKREFLPQVTSLMGEIIQSPRLDDSEMEVLKRQIIVNLQQNSTEPTAVAPRSVQRTLSPYPRGSVLYQPTVDEEIEMYQSVTAEQVRDLYENFIGNQAGEFTAVGDFDSEDLLAQVRAAVGNLTTEEPYVRVDRPATIETASLDTIQTDDKANAFYFASQQYEMSDADPKFASLVLGNYILGAGALSSRLGDRVRQQEGLSYSVRSSISPRSKDNRVDFLVYAITNPTNKDKLIRVIAEELDKLIADGITEKELADAKEAYLQSAQVGRTSDAALAGELLSNLFLDRTMQFTQDMEDQIRAATVESVNEAIATTIRPDALTAAIAGDFETE